MEKNEQFKTVGTEKKNKMCNRCSYKKAIESLFDWRGCMNDNYITEDLPLHIEPEVREKCNN